MKNTGIRALAQQLQTMGRDGDTILAHIMPHEAAMLKRMGGRGTVNPRTGLLEFAGADPSGSSVTSSNYSGGSSASSYTGGSDLGGYTGSGGGWTPSGGGGGGGGGGSYFSDLGGGTPTNTDGGFDSANFGVGTGMLTAGTPTMVSSGGSAFTPMGASSSNFLQSLGVPTIVANAASTVGQSLLDFSDWSTNQYRQMMGGLTPTTSFPSSPGFRSEAALEAATTPQSNIDPLTGRDYGREAVQRSIAWGETIGSGIASLRDMLSAPQEVAPSTPGFRSEAASGVYDFTPDYTGTTREAEALRNQILSQDVNRMWGITPERQGDFGPAPQGFDVSAEDVTRQIMTPTGITIQPTSSIPVEYAGQERDIMEQIMSAPPSPQSTTPGFRSEAAAGDYTVSPVSLPGFRSEAALDSLTPSQEAGLPSTTASATAFDMNKAIQDFRTNLGNVKYGLVSLNTLGVNTPGSERYMTDEAIAKSITETLANDPRLAGSIVGSGAGISADTPEVQAAIRDLATSPYTIKDLGAYNENLAGKTMTLSPSTWDVKTGLSVPMPPERPSDTTMVASAPEPVVTTRGIPAPQPTQIGYPETGWSDSANLADLLDATFYQYAGGMPMTREFGYPGQEVDINYAAYTGAVPSYMTMPTMVAEAAPPVTTRPAAPVVEPVAAPIAAPVVEPPRPPAEIATAVQIASSLEEEFNNIVSGGGGGGGGGGSGSGYRAPTSPTEPSEEDPTPSTPPTPVYSTGMDLTRRTYAPRQPIETLSPAYS